MLHKSIIALLILIPVLAYSASPKADKIRVSTDSFNGVLSDVDVNAQLAFDTLDDASSGAEDLSDLTDVDTTGATQNYRLIYNGSLWVAVPEDTSFTFTFNSFTDNQSSPQLIGAGEWQAIGGITFSATYSNGPPTSMVCVISGDFDGGSGSGWTSNELTFVDAPKTSSTTVEGTNYPDDVLDVITFTATADAEPTKNTTVTFWNQFRYDGAETGTYNQAFIDALAGSDLDNDSTQTASSSGWSVVMSVTEYTFFAAPSRFSLNVNRFRYATGGEELQALFTEVGSNISWTNSAGYAENYDVFQSVIQDMADGTVGIGQSAERLRYYWGYSTVSSSFDETEVEAISNNTINQTNDSTQTWGTFDVPAGNYLNLAVSGDATDLTVGTDYETDGNTGTSFLFDGMTAAFNTKESVNITNEFGYLQAYDVYGGNQTNPGVDGGSGSFVTGSVQTLNKIIYGITSKTGSYTEADIEALPDDDGFDPITNDFTQLWNAVTQGPGEYGLWCFPKRMGEKDVDYSFKDNDTGLGFDFQAAETVSVTNENGWSEDYYAYRTTNANLGEINVETVP